MSVLENGAWICTHCGARNLVEVDLSGRHHQEFTEDCDRCCRPHVLTIDIDTKTQEFRLEARAENR